MPGAVSDSSTLIHLAAIRQIELLRELFGQVLIPPAVWREVVEDGRDRPGVHEVREAAAVGWIKIVAPTNRALLQILSRDLDAGETEAIALALECQADVVLLDESDARRVASLYHLRKTGVVGVLMRARLDGRIPTLRVALDQLREGAGFWISDDLYRIALEAVGEGTAR